jgi:hypothetical protein
MQQLMGRQEDLVTRLEANVADGGYLFRTCGALVIADGEVIPRRIVEELGSIQPDGTGELVIADRAYIIDIDADYGDNFKNVIYTGLKLSGVKRGALLKRHVKVDYNRLDLDDIVVFEDEEGSKIKTMGNVSWLSTSQLYET